MGALEDDDEDVYHRDSMSRYDTVLGEEPGDGLYGWTAPQQYTRRKGEAHTCRVGAFQSFRRRLLQSGKSL